jgi:glycosyltransferase involved in cell wall biosynthesis
MAIIVPTKDRPDYVKRFLQSVKELDCQTGRVIVVASGQDIKYVVLAFKEFLPVEYYTCEPGQIRQRNRGISLLDDRTKLVATMDDDAVLHTTAVTEMIHFWNSVESETAGVGFNIVNQPGHKHTWLRGLFGVSVPEPGKILKSGHNTAITKVKENFKSEWLNGGATVWRQDILKNYTHQEIQSSWAVCEDLIYSYPIGKKHPLYICANATIEIENIVLQKSYLIELFQRGKTQLLWQMYFVSTDSTLSKYKLFYSKIIEVLYCIIKSFFHRNMGHLFYSMGMINGILLCVKLIIFKKNIIEIIKNQV